MIEIRIRTVDNPFKFGCDIHRGCAFVEGYAPLAEKQCLAEIKKYMQSFPERIVHNWEQICNGETVYEYE